MKKILSILSILILIGGAALAQDSGLLSDPMTIGVGARALGMGKTYVGVAEDADAIFMNPAGIARITNPKLSSMYTSLLNEVDYMVIGGAYPLGKKSAIGAGVINSSMGSIPTSTTAGESTGTGGWGNTVLFLSYGTYLSEIPIPALASLEKDVLIGGNLKYFSVGGSGSNDVVDAADAAGTGVGVDLGVLYPATDYLMLGANYQNAISTQIGKGTDVSDVVPSCLKLGARFAILGREGKSYTLHRVRKLYANVDYDVMSNGLPNIPHYGIEFWPSNNLALRIGADDNEMTAGIGLRFSGIEFNYAYHPYNGIPDNATHFFSLAYLGEALKRELRVQIDSPTDKSVIHEDHVNVSGKIEVVEGDESEGPAGPIAVKVNGVNVPIGSDLSFSAEVPVDTVGKKLLLVEASDAAGDFGSKEIRLVRLINFADVPEGYWAKVPIENTGTVGLVEGYPDGTFKPERALTRAELSTLLVRAKGLKIPEGRAKQVFKDVKPDHWAAKYIEVAQKAGLVEGYPDRTFRPNNKINKAEGVTVLVRFDNLRLAEVYEKPFWDVSTDNWAAKYIQAAKDAGMLKYVERNVLRPKENLARSEAVEMLAKTSLAGGKIQDLYSWEKGFRRETVPERPRIRASIY
jgi:hypothetical protein